MERFSIISWEYWGWLIDCFPLGFFSLSLSLYQARSINLGSVGFSARHMNMTWVVEVRRQKGLDKGLCRQTHALTSRTFTSRRRYR